MLFAGPTGMAFMLVWLRLSTNRQLDWYRGSSHQSKDIAHIQKTLAQRMADKVITTMPQAPVCQSKQSQNSNDSHVLIYLQPYVRPYSPELPPLRLGRYTGQDLQIFKAFLTAAGQGQR